MKLIEAADGQVEEFIQLIEPGSIVDLRKVSQIVAWPILSLQYYRSVFAMRKSGYDFDYPQGVVHEGVVRLELLVIEYNVLVWVRARIVTFDDVVPVFPIV